MEKITVNHSSAPSALIVPVARTGHAVGASTAVCINTAAKNWPQNNLLKISKKKA